MTAEAIKKTKEAHNELWCKCKKCMQITYKKELEENFHVCPKCGNHYPLRAMERVKMLLDIGSEVEFDANLEAGDPLEFLDGKLYKEKTKLNQEKAQLKDAIWTGKGKLDGTDVALAVMDFMFLGGSMGSVVGEKITRICEHALDHKLPIIIVSTSGGARMHEGIFSLMQMAKISAVLSRVKEAGLPYISVITDPTTGGVTASFAMLGDVIYAEPDALIGFAGPRVIEQTIRQTLPQGFQRSEFLMKHGMLDRIIPRSELKEELKKTLKVFEKNIPTQ